MRWRHLALLVVLYVAQGIPFGFAVTFVPLQLAHAADFTYSKTTLIHLAGFPWMLKMLWAPAVDSRYSARIGRRKSWILPAQAMLATVMLGASTLDYHHVRLAPLLGVVVAMNLFASLQDTAVDALAIDLLPPEARGIGNAAQVGGYKLGMLIGGGGLVLVSSRVGTGIGLALLAAIIGVVMASLTLFHEARPSAQVEAKAHHHGTRALAEVGRHLIEPRWLLTLLFIATVKVGESMVGSVLKPFAVRDLHLSDTQATLSIGFIGGALSLVGSLVGGAIAGRVGRMRLLWIFGVTQAIGMIILGLAIRWTLPLPLLTAAIGLQHLSVGLLTPVLFAYMMDIADPVLGATHYTLMATTELAAKNLAVLATGSIADAIGVPTLVTAVGVFGALPLLLLPKLIRPNTPTPSVARAA